MYLQLAGILPGGPRCKQVACWEHVHVSQLCGSAGIKAAALTWTAM